MTDAADLNPAADAAPEAAPPAPPPGPGAMLRAAREARGLSLETLAAQLKVHPRKLESLEADRLQELPDLIFVRALTQSVCRVLKLEAGPALAMLPSAPARAIEVMAEGLDQPFREPGAPRLAWLQGWSLRGQPRVWLAGLLGLGALILLAGPLDLPSFGRGEPDSPTSAPAASAVVVVPLRPLPAPGAGPVAQGGNPVAPAPAAPAPTPAPARAVDAPTTAPTAPSPAAASAAGLQAPPAAEAPASGTALRLNLTGGIASWVEVRDAQGKILLSTLLRPGKEQAQIEATGPLRLVIGHAPGTELSRAGQRVDLAPHTRGNVARLELP